MPRQFRHKFVAIASFSTLGLVGVAMGLSAAMPERTLTTRSEAARDLYFEGMEYFTGMQYPKASEQFTRATELDSTFAMAWVRLASIQYAYGQRDLAQASLERARHQVERLSDLERMRIASTEARFASDHARQLEISKQIVARYPADQESYFAIHSNAMREGRIEEAADAMERVIEINPGAAMAYNTLGYTLILLDRHEEALEAFQKYAFMNPDTPNPHDSLGELYELLGRYDDAMAEYERALELDPVFLWSVTHRARALTTQGRYGEAVQELATAHREHATEPHAWMLVEFQACILGWNGQAEKGLELVAAHRDEFLDPHALASIEGSLHAMRGDVVRAEASLRQLHAIAESRAPEQPGAVEELETSITYLMLQAMLHDARGEDMAAAERWNAVLDKVHLESHLREYAQLRLCGSLLAIGRADQAMETTAEILRRNPRHPEAQYWQARAIEKVSGFEAAREAYGNAVALWHAADDGHRGRADAQMRLDGHARAS